MTQNNILVVRGGGDLASGVIQDVYKRQLQSFPENLTENSVLHIPAELIFIILTGSLAAAYGR